MSRIAIIPARGGSKRIPKKNIKTFLGKPIIAYSIQVALKSKLFDEVMVSTDDDEIAEVAVKYGAKVPFIRSKKNADDYAVTIDVINEVLCDYKAKFKKTFKYACCIYPTAPLIRADYLKEGLEKLINKKYDTVFPVVPFGYPIWRSLEKTSDNKVKMIWPENENMRSQDLKEVFHDAGQWYWFDVLRITNSFITNNSGAIVLSNEFVQDIDNNEDWKLAEIKYRYMQGQ